MALLFTHNFRILLTRLDRWWIDTLEHGSDKSTEVLKQGFTNRLVTSPWRWPYFLYSMAQFLSREERTGEETILGKMWRCDRKILHASDFIWMEMCCIFLNSVSVMWQRQCASFTTKVVLSDVYMWIFLWRDFVTAIISVQHTVTEICK